MGDSPKKIECNNLNEQIRCLRSLRGILDDETIEQKEKELQHLIDQKNDKSGIKSILENDIITNYSNSRVEQSKILATLSERSVVVGGNAQYLTIVTGDGNTITLSPDQVSSEVLLKAYYRSLANECSSLPLGIVDPRFAQPNQVDEVSLNDVYTELDVTAPLSQENLIRHSEANRLPRDENKITRVPLLHAITDSSASKVVLLGDAGSGKSTFINYLSHCLVQTFVDDKVDSVPPTLRGRLVIRIVLRNAIEQLRSKDPKGSAQMLWSAIENDISIRLGKSSLKNLFPYIQQRIWSEGGIFLLDGLDEVPEAGRRRKVLLDAIQGLIAGLPSQSRFLLTARPYAYADPAWQLPGFKVLILAPFNNKQKKKFIEHFHKAICHLKCWNIITAEERAERLLHTLQIRPFLSDLASRPLLLTLIATLHTSWGQLPEDRADLYEESTKLLLSRWEKGREVKSANGKRVVEPSLVRVLQIKEDLLRTILESLAYNIHVRHGSEKNRDNGVADISFGEVLAAFSPLLPDDFNPRLLLDYLESRSGLLVGRRERMFSFPHRSFQEYFAACYLANDQDFGPKLKKLVWEDPEWWREVCLLAIGKARQGGMANAISILNILLPEEIIHLDNIQNNHWQLAVLVGQALVELRLNERAMSQPHYRAIQKRTIRWLTALMEGSHLSSRNRLLAANALGRLGDPRAGIGTIEDPSSRKILPDIIWKEIPAGFFKMGSSDADQHSYEDERPLHTIKLPTFYISCYPITNAQFRPFVDANGYHNERYWTHDGWMWRTGHKENFFNQAVSYDDERKKQYMAWTKRRTGKRRNQPYWWDDSHWNVPNRPVVGISWYEAVAYCRWLDEQLRKANHHLLSNDFIVRLPNEAEWEKASRGPIDERLWPWGDKWSDDLANTTELGLRQTSPVGLFPSGRSYYGVHDMSGNVYEWVATRYGHHNNTTSSTFKYPYNTEDGRDDLNGLDIRIVRGGAWYFDKWCARCSGRDWDYPVIFDQNTGFRIVISFTI